MKRTREPADEAEPGFRVAERDVEGKLTVHPAGYGFVARDDGREDVFVPARYRGAALDGDRVKVDTWPSVKGTEGRVTEVLARGRAKITGVLRARGRQAEVEPDDPRLAGPVLLDAGGPSAHDGEAVLCEITQYPDEGAPMRARVLRALGPLDDPRTEIAKVIALAEIPDEFPEEVLAAAARTPAELAPEDLVDRVDLRDLDFVTIDPVTARDFDDAVYVEPPGDGQKGRFRLWVAVADVSHYVRPGTALDREAVIRGCSVYLPDRAIPMLPHQLSSGICSLNPEVDRCAMVVRMDVQDGRVVDRMICAALIRSHARLDYAGVAAALDGDLRGPRARYAPHLPHLLRIKEVSDAMRARRRERGGLELDLPEAQVILDRDDPLLVRDVRKSKGDPAVKGAYGMVEDCMLAANETVAAYLREKGFEAPWRVHDRPDPDRLAEFATAAEALGLRVRPDELEEPRGLQRVLADLEGRPAQRSLNFLLLRSLKQAQYDVVPIGHFGLGAQDYLHFTSPIRRYPDLLTHRIVKAALHREGLPAGGLGRQGPVVGGELKELCRSSSEAERRAMEAEREVVDMYRAWMMRDRVGDELEGVISGVAGFGVFVEIEDPFVEGMIRTQSLGMDRYEVDDTGVRLVGRRSGHAFALGMPLKVRVENVSVQRRRIDFALAGRVPAEDGRPGRGRGRPGRAEPGKKARPGKRERETRRGSRS